MTALDDNRLVARRPLEVAGWIVIVTVLWGTDLLAKLAERDQFGIGKDTFRLVSEQVTSAIAVLIMILFVTYWLRLFPLRRDTWVAAITGHTAGTIIFAFGHHVLMVAMRIPWYALNDIYYVWREPFVANLIVEYQKDLKIYFGIVLIASAYQWYRRSRRSTSPTQPGDRLVVQTGQGVSVLRFEQIEHLEAARNYVAVHADGREYIVRDTLTNLIARLPAERFVRAHRSFVVNVDKIVEIRAVDSRQRIFLNSGNDVPLSRGYRDELTKQIGGQIEG